jgi:hypothetical protein
VPEKQILPKMEPMVLAVHHPKIPTVFPHTSRLRGVTRGQGLSVPEWSGTRNRTSKRRNERAAMGERIDG